MNKLKGKIFVWDEEEDDFVRNKQSNSYENPLGSDIIKVNDIESAIKWLKEQIEEAEPKFRDEDSIISLINEAFEDVTKKRT